MLIFSYFADTVDWIVEHLTEVIAIDDRLAGYRDRIASLSGSWGGEKKKEEVLWGFAPRTTDAPEGFDADRFDIVVTTDVLAEGVNLRCVADRPQPHPRTVELARRQGEPRTEDPEGPTTGQDASSAGRS